MLTFDVLAEYMREQGWLLFVSAEGNGWLIESDLWEGKRHYPRLSMAVPPLAAALVEHASGKKGVRQ